MLQRKNVLGRRNRKCKVPKDKFDVFKARKKVGFNEENKDVLQNRQMVVLMKILWQ